MWQIWIDTGGTFTDCIALDTNNTIQRLKILSSGTIRGKVLEKIDELTLKVEISTVIHSDIFEGYSIVFQNIKMDLEIESYDVNHSVLKLKKPFNHEISADTDFSITANEPVPVLAARILTSTKLKDDFPLLTMRLGTTKGTNALLEKKGAKVVFIVTSGFKDLLKIGTQQRPNLFELNIKKGPPLHHQVIEVDERITSKGEIIKHLNEINEFPVSNDSSLAITLLNSYKNDIHELELESYFRKKGFKHISISTKLSKAIKFLPRAETTVVNAYLDPVMGDYLGSIIQKIKKENLKVISSAGAIVNSNKYFPKDGLLSGPAGGIVGAQYISKLVNETQIITFDMGGTSTDVSLYDNGISYTYETKVGEATIQSPCVDIDTIAAGGGSICTILNDELRVGPESAGAAPGPACYGLNGPLSMTDINLLAGRLVENQFAIPIDQEESEKVLDKLILTLNSSSTKDHLVQSFIDIANEKMSAAIKKIATKKGADIEDFALTAFGGAGGQHACDIAEILNIKKVIIPYDAGILSALGIGLADEDIIREKLILKGLSEFLIKGAQELEQIATRLKSSFKNKSSETDRIITKHKFCYLRFKGQDETLEIDFAQETDLYQAFKTKYESIYKHWLEGREIEVESVKVIVSILTNQTISAPKNAKSIRQSIKIDHKSLVNGKYINTPVYKWESIPYDSVISGPAVVVSDNCTVYVNQYWDFELNHYNIAQLTKTKESISKLYSQPVEASRTLFQNRFLNVVEEMGAVLERCSFSVNIKERLDFSCALLDKHGDLIVNAPHIPVHLGSMGICTRAVANKIPLKEGDIAITNHPGYGGSHLPDVTLISPIYYKQELVAYVSNRAHHSEIGGRTPGSMPTDAQFLEEEGVIIPPQLLVENGVTQFEKIEKLLANAKYPSRSIQENMADLMGAIASINSGIEGFKNLCNKYDVDLVQRSMSDMKEHAASLLQLKLKKMKSGSYKASEYLDDGSVLSVEIIINPNAITFNFNGTSEVNNSNLNANGAIVQSVILYVLRIIVDEDIPLNEGLMDNVKVILPQSLLNPNFHIDQPPAVVGGNTEVSQRLTDTLLKALKLSACSQGTMNNLLFGDETFGYYETIGGGTGAGETFDGQDAIHQHMTNTKITDPEILEFRYPIRLDKFQIRENSGGEGIHKGGNGIIRKLTFLKKLNLVLLTQHRNINPYGLLGGNEGKKGEQFLIKKNGSKTVLSSSDSCVVEAGDSLTIKTPGGGGFGINQTD